MLKEGTLNIKGTLSIVISLGNFYQIVKTKKYRGAWYSNDNISRTIDAMKKTKSDLERR